MQPAGGLERLRRFRAAALRNVAAGRSGSKGSLEHALERISPKSNRPLRAATCRVMRKITNHENHLQNNPDFDMSLFYRRTLCLCHYCSGRNDADRPNNTSNLLA